MHNTIRSSDPKIVELFTNAPARAAEEEAPASSAYDPLTTIERVYAEQGKRFSDQTPNLYDTLEERARIARVVADERRDLRAMRRQAIVKWFAILTAYGAAVYFFFELGRGL